MSEHRFSTPEALDSALCENISNRLGQALEQRGTAYLVVSGGSTPKGLFKRLANANLDWSRVTVLLADERWVSTTHPDCNESLVRRTLLQNKAAAANFQSLLPAYPDLTANVQRVDAEVAALPRFDVVLLGMGADSHTASLFPCAPEIESALSTTANALATHPTTAPHARVTLSKHRLENTDWGVVHITGADKYRIAVQAQDQADVYAAPVGAMLPPRGRFELWCTHDG